MQKMTTLRVFRTDDAEMRYRAIYDKRVQDWPVQCDELDVPTRFGTSHVIASGPVDARALFLLPAMMVGATQWRASVAELSRQFRVFAVDLIGEPNKGKPTRGINTRHGYADWFTDLLDALNIERASIVGNSYGGFLALSQASLTPERVDRIVLLSPAETLAPIGWRFYAHMLPLGFLGLLPSFRTRAFAAMMSWVANGTPPDRRDENIIELMKISVLEGRPAGIVRPRVFSRTELAAIRAPTLLLIGNKEVIYQPEATLRRALARMPGLEGAIVPSANHLTAMSQPDAVNARIIEFLQRKIQ
jgi:pimeloyl-ACP methyl ester carboxylesterase